MPVFLSKKEKEALIKVSEALSERKRRKELNYLEHQKLLSVPKMGDHKKIALDVFKAEHKSLQTAEFVYCETELRNVDDMQNLSKTIDIVATVCCFYGTNVKAELKKLQSSVAAA